MTLHELLERLEEFDLLLSTDPRFPSVSGIVVGESIPGSWWAHPQAHDMFRLSCELVAHPDVLRLVLISGKVTLVNRPLWPAIYAIGIAREPWQMRGLCKESKDLLRRVDNETRLNATGDAVRVLEKSMLVHCATYHTEHGSHAKELQTWQSWADRVKLGKVKMPPAEARAQLEQVVARLNKQFAANGRLPWQRGAGPRHAGKPKKPAL